jgi:hypothetical protein
MLHGTPFKIRSRKGARIEQYFLDIGCETVPIPDPIVAELMPP